MVDWQSESDIVDTSRHWLQWLQLLQRQRFRWLTDSQRVTWTAFAILAMFNLMKTSFQEERSWHEAENRPAHILFGSLHRKWKYVSKGKKTKLSIYHLCTYESFPRKGRTQNGLSGQGQKLHNHTSPHILKMRKYALFEFFTVLKLPRKFWNQPEISRIFWKVF